MKISAFHLPFRLPAVQALIVRLRRALQSLDRPNPKTTTKPIKASQVIVKKIQRYAAHIWNFALINCGSK
jgi:hypothetical protein